MPILFLLLYLAPPYTDIYSPSLHDALPIFKQAFAIVAHAEIVIALQQLFILPLNYVRETMSSATTLAVFVPMLDETSFLDRKSTRLNSSHLVISYAVFCLK